MTTSIFPGKVRFSLHVLKKEEIRHSGRAKIGARDRGFPETVGLSRFYYVADQVNIILQRDYYYFHHVQPRSLIECSGQVIYVCLPKRQNHVK